MESTNELEKIFNEPEPTVDLTKPKVYSPKDKPEWVDYLEKNGTAHYSYGLEEVELLLWSK